MLIKSLPVGYLDTNCYIVTNDETRECVIIDPGADSNAILDYIESNNLTPTAVFLTHGHFDHHMALGPVLDATGVSAYVHSGDVAISDNRRQGQLKLDDDERLLRYDEGDEINTAGMKFTVMSTPGHSPGSVTLRCQSALFTGDTLFRDYCGRTDFPGGNTEEMLASFRRLAALEGDFEVYPGHAESSTLNRERSFNHFMKLAISE